MKKLINLAKLVLKHGIRDACIYYLFPNYDNDIDAVSIFKINDIESIKVLKGIHYHGNKIDVIDLSGSKEIEYVNISNCNNLKEVILVKYLYL